jgi:hypothetical protein
MLRTTFDISAVSPDEAARFQILTPTSNLCGESSSGRGRVQNEPCSMLVRELKAQVWNRGTVCFTSVTLRIWRSPRLRTFRSLPGSSQAREHSCELSGVRGVHCSQG